MTEPAEIQLKLVESLEEAQECARWLGERRPILAIDTETGGLDWWRDPLRTVQLGDGQTGWTIPVEGPLSWGALVHDLLDAYDGPIAMQNQSFDVKFLERNQYPVRRARIYDTKVMGKLLDPTRAAGLKSMADKYLGGGSGSQRDLRDKMNSNGWTWATVPIKLPIYWQYAALDTILTARLAEKLWPMMQSYRNVYDLEIAAQHVLTDMEMRGVRIDLEYIQTRLNAWTTEVHRLETDARAEYGIANIHANEQVYSRLTRDGVELVRMTKTGQPELTDDVLSGLEHPLAAIVQRVRKLTKLCSAYLENFIALADGDILHPSVNAYGARTGRMSINRPSLQNLPRGQDIRDAFLPRIGRSLVMADFAGIEMRLLAHYSGDPEMIAAYLRGEDLHDFASRLIYGADFTKTQRSTAKNAGFAKIYGAGTTRIARTAHVSVAEATAAVEAWDAAFPGVAPFLQRVIDTVNDRYRAEKRGYVTTTLGRPEPCEPREGYKAVNYLIQGTAADVFKQALVRLDSAGLAEYAVLPVHDEVVFDVPLEDVGGHEEFSHAIAKTLSDPDGFVVPLTVEVSKPYERWGEKFADGG